MGSRFFPETLRETAYQVFKDITAIHGAYPVRTKITFRAVEFLDCKVQCIALHHSLDDVFKIELREDILHIGRKACQIVAEIGFNILGASSFSKVNLLIL